MPDNRKTMETLLQNTRDALANSSSTAPALNSVLLPVIKRVMPNIIAQDIISVQPMGSVYPYYNAWSKVGIHIPTDHWVYNVRSQEIRTWIEEQPAYMWKFYDIDVYNLDLPASVILGSNYVFTEEMEAWFTLRWS